VCLGICAGAAPFGGSSPEHRNIAFVFKRSTYCVTWCILNSKLTFEHLQATQQHQSSMGGANPMAGWNQRTTEPTSWATQGTEELGSWGAEELTRRPPYRNAEIPQGWHWFAGGGKGRGRRSPGSANYDPVRSRIGTEQPARLNCFCVIAFSKWILVPLPPITV